MPKKTMSLYLNRNIDNDTILGIWKIEEIFNWFISQSQLNNEDRQFVNHYKSEQRKIHWLSTQLLLRHLLNSKKKVEINYDQNGKPHLTDSMYEISISHSNKFVAIQLSKTCAGIDIQQVTQKIKRIATKFMNAQEINSLEENNYIEQLHVYWGAKETLYKIYGKRALHFKKNLLIEPFEYKGKGVINGCISIGKMKPHLTGDHPIGWETYSLHYEKIENYMLVYVLKKSTNSESIRIQDKDK